MARSKHHKRKKQHKKHRPAFYEALLPVGDWDTTTNLREPLRAGADTLATYSRLASEQLLRWRLIMALKSQLIWDISIAVLHRMGGFLDQFWLDTEPYRRQGQRTLHAVWATSRAYAPAIGADLDRGLTRIRRSLWNRRSRSLYLALMATATLASVVVVTLVSASTMSLYAHDIASPAALMNKKKTGTTILDRNGQVLFEGYGAQSGRIVPLAEIPQQLKDATLAAEDPDFYDHPGFSWRATARAAWVDITQRGKVEGGSTLTQQLVKNAILTQDKTFERKYQEFVISMELERKYSKHQILEMYLNETFYGQGSSGVEAAAQTYFHKPLSNLTLSETALLAGLPLGPSRFDPNANLSAATDRRNYVLDRMATFGKITAEQAAAAKAEPVQAFPKTITIRAPHFVFYVLNQLRAQYGQDMIENGGLTVRTTLDLGKQEAGQKIIQDQIARLASHHATNGGLISIEPGTGDIISMVGSVDYHAPGFGAVNVTLSNLQPGSSFKPIAYVTAFQKGWNGSTEIDDKPIQLPNGDGSLYIPQNYDGKFRGKVTLRRALSNSLNIPAIEVLQYAGLNETIDMAHNLGITTLNERSRYGVSLVLGGGEVRPIDMATVYATLANSGTKVEPRAILRVTDRYDKDITKPTQAAAKPVVDPKHTYMVTNILSDNAARTEEFGSNSPLKLSRPAAAKTGTTNDFRDNWTVGYTPNLVTAVWVGNNDHSPMSNVDGITGAAPIWHDYMEMAHAGIPVQNFTMPAGLVTAKVCAANGGLAGPGEPAYDEVFLANQPFTRRCALPVPIIQAEPQPQTTDPLIPMIPIMGFSPPPEFTIPTPPHGRQGADPWPN